MARLNIDERLRKLKDRRTDKQTLVENLSKSFSENKVPKTVKWIFESMIPIENAYTRKTYVEAERIQNQISINLPASISVKFDYQGSVPLNTHIKTHSDLDILVVHNNFYSVHPPLTIKPEEVYNGDPNADLRNLRQKVYDILKKEFPTAIVKDINAKAISIEGGSLSRKFDVIICNKLETKEFQDSTAIPKPKKHLGLKIYDKKLDERLSDFPFAHMNNVDFKNDNLGNDNYKRVIRLLKTLKMDAEPVIDLSSFMITSLMYNMDNTFYNYNHKDTLKLLVNVSQFLDKVTNNPTYRATIKSPTGMENLFAENDEHKNQQFKRLKKELDDIIIEAATEIEPYQSRNYTDNLSIKPFYTILENANYIY